MRVGGVGRFVRMLANSRELENMVALIGQLAGG